ncbi:hypothetical protein Pmani_012083 [Petrolisthes manimaculis]|uniref:Uncharacterized protein n=1 Tax=Petrolisthes manimaculis TaxID=1843537 RepID=A0AAE1PA67_9EUCA|nr:hypothetical protein Pmani_024405 [Petrolisthes manimaculis]KAK4316780.1 hypothetical protein Pmani_012083 [Petrolisthes manimaculis]
MGRAGDMGYGRKGTPAPFGRDNDARGKVRSLGDDAGGGGIVGGVVVVWVAVWLMVGAGLASMGARCGDCVVVVV